MAQHPTTDWPIRGYNGKFPIRAPIPPSCTLGYTAADLCIIFPGDAGRRFDSWMYGQTMSICDGRSYRYNREHTGKCTTECKSANCLDHCNHDEGDEFTWKCDYSGGGEYEPSVCNGDAHGLVTYSWDVERYIESLVTGRPTVWD